jgi:hypothetical protein
MANRNLRADSARENRYSKFPGNVVGLGGRLGIEILKACKRHGIERAEFGRRAAGDPRFVSDIQHGRRPNRHTEARVRAFLAQLETAK